MIGNREASFKRRCARVVPMLREPRMGPKLFGGGRSLGTTPWIQAFGRELNWRQVLQR
jgi:hypothetical protein